MSENNNEEKLQERLRNLENSSLKTVRDANDALKNCLEENEKLRQELRFDSIFNVRLRNQNYFSNLRLLQQQSVNKLVQVAEDTLVCEGGADSVKIKQQAKIIKNQDKEISSLKKTNEKLEKELADLKARTPTKISVSNSIKAKMSELKAENSELKALNTELSEKLSKLSTNEQPRLRNHSESTITNAQYEEIMSRLEGVEVQNQGLQALIRRQYVKSVKDEETRSNRLSKITTSSDCSSMQFYTGENEAKSNPNAKLGVQIENDYSDEASIKL